jgi:hypothetical protein
MCQAGQRKVLPETVIEMDELDKLALAAAREVMQNQHDASEDDHLRIAARMVLNMAVEKGWLSHNGEETSPAQ